MSKITLLLDRHTGDLWVDRNDHIACIWDVTGLERNTESLSGHVRVLRKGQSIGGVWHVEEIRERW